MIAKPLNWYLPSRIWSVATESVLDADAGQLPRKIKIGLRGADDVTRYVQITCARYMDETTFEANCRKLRLLLCESVLSAEIIEQDILYMTYADKPENRFVVIAGIRDVDYTP